MPSKRDHVLLIIVNLWWYILIPWLMCIINCSYSFTQLHYMCSFLVLNLVCYWLWTAECCVRLTMLFTPLTLLLVISWLVIVQPVQQIWWYIPQEDGIYQDKVNYILTKKGICTVNGNLFVQHAWHGCLLLVVVMMLQLAFTLYH